MSDREREVWEDAWRAPQAAAWAVEAWRHRMVALWVRWSVRIEDASAGASLVGQVIRLADQVGLTPAGLKENGWKIAAPEVPAPAKRPPSTSRVAPRDRLKVV